jgi:carboxypeptidase C (cathepsin A)
MRFRLTAARFLAVAAMAAGLPWCPAAGAQEPAAEPKADAKPSAKKEPAPAPTPTPAADVPPAPAAAVSHHRMTVGGKPIAYTATAGTIDLKNGKGETEARMFSVAYTADGPDAKQRPVTFLFNGGPGSATIWLHMGSFGPMRVETPDAGPTPPAPYRLIENADSLLDRTDLVFIDAIGTGFSRIVGKGEGKNFYGTDQDVAAFGQFIERWLSANGRWNSPKFLLGESYGTTRAAALLHYLEKRGVAFNGAILVSSYLNAWDDINGPPFANDRAYELYLPTLAATAWYYKKLDPRPPDLAAFLVEVRQFALGEYEQALQKGNKIDPATRAAVAAKLHRYTSLPEAYILSANLRLDPSRFQKELLRGERRTVGRLDGRYQGIDHDAAGETPEYDPADTAIGAAFTAALNGYVRETLAYKTDELYKPENEEEVAKEWDDRHRTASGRAPMPDVAEDLRAVMSLNPSLKIFSANGYFDFATPFFETEYTLGHMGLDPTLEKNISFGYYQSGHMIYLHEPSLRQLKTDLARFYDQTLAR